MITSCYVLMNELPGANFPGKSAIYILLLAVTHLFGWLLLKSLGLGLAFSRCHYLKNGFSFVYGVVLSQL